MGEVAAAEFARSHEPYVYVGLFEEEQRREEMLRAEREAELEAEFWVGPAGGRAGAYALRRHRARDAWCVCLGAEVVEERGAGEYLEALAALERVSGEPAQGTLRVVSRAGRRPGCRHAGMTLAA